MQLQFNRLSLPAGSIITNVFCGKASTFIEVRKLNNKIIGTVDYSEEKEYKNKKRARGGSASINDYYDSLYDDISSPSSLSQLYYAVGRNACGELGCGIVCETVEEPQEIKAFRGLDVSYRRSKCRRKKIRSNFNQHVFTIEGN